MTRACALILALGLATSLRAEVLTFAVDPTQSSVTLSGSASGADLQEQSPGSLTTTFNGVLVLDVTTAFVQFPGGSRLIPQELNSWQPGTGGVDGTALASYGAKAQIGSGLFSVSAVAATRRLAFDVLSSPLALQGGSFSAEGLQFQFVETNNPTLDYKTSGLLNSHDGQPLSGLATNKIAGVSTLATAGTVQTLTLKVSATYRFGLLVPDDSELSLSGQIVATRTVTDVPPTIIITPPAIGATAMILTWPAGYKLQKSPQLLIPVWADTGAASPATISFATDGEYFQIVPQ
jgi:hypothetical protein